MSRVIIVSNRLPVSVFPDKEPPEDVVPSSGGLVSALKDIVGEYDEVLWLGWPGNYCSSQAEEARMTQRLGETSTAIRMRPVWLSKSDVEDFYNGFSNSSLWPLLHWMTPYARFKKTWSESYRRVNMKFAEAIMSVARPTDVVWIHDYHLFLAPQMVRKLIAEETEKSQPPPGTPAARPKDLPPVDSEEREPDGSLVRFQSTDSLGALSNANSLSSSAATRMQDAMSRAQAPSPALTRGTSGRLDATKRVSFSPPVRPDAGAQRQSWESLKVGFFLHTPFPSFEVISTLPICEDIVEGMLGADLIGFHTYNYLRHYRSCVIRLCGFTPEMDMVEHMGRRTRLGVFPIGANCNVIKESMRSEKFVEYLQKYTDDLEGKSLVLSVERLDYTKGISQKLAAIEQYLEEAAAEKKAKKLRQEKGQQESEAAKSPSQEDEERRRLGGLAEAVKRFEDRVVEQKHHSRYGLRTAVSQLWNKTLSLGAKEEKDDDLDHTKTVFVFVAVPSRQTVQEYKSIEEEVHRTISTINGRFGSVNEMPIHYIHRSISEDELTALYARADCCLVTPLVDGMNLVAKEFVASKDPTVENVVPGTIVLSEFAGACQELFDALVVNPYDIDTVADAIRLGLELTKGDDGLDGDSRWSPTSRMRESVIKNDAVAWAKRFLEDLATDLAIGPRPLSRLATQMITMFARDFGKDVEGVKAIFFNFDGSLKEGEAESLPQYLFELLAAVHEREDLLVCIVSGHTKELVGRVFGRFSSFVCVAEHGMFVRRPRESWQALGRDDSLSWMKKVQPLMELFQRCTPHAQLDVRGSSIAWHYADCDEDYGTFKTKELVHQLALSTGNLPCEVNQGDKVVEVKSLHVKNGYAVAALLSEWELAHGKIETIFTLSDDTTDESMFAPIPGRQPYTARVGCGETEAAHCFDNWGEVCQYFDLFLGEGEGGKDRSSSDGRFQSCYERQRSMESFGSDSHFGGLPIDEGG